MTGMDHHLLRPRAENQPALLIRDVAPHPRSPPRGTASRLISAVEYSLLITVTGMSPILLRAAQASFST